MTREGKQTLIVHQESISYCAFTVLFYDHRFCLSAAILVTEGDVNFEQLGDDVFYTVDGVKQTGEVVKTTEV